MSPRTPALPAVPPPRPGVVIENVWPVVDCGRFAAKAVVGDELVVEADVFGHGHVLVRAALCHRRAGARQWSLVPMAALGNDRFAASIVPNAPGAIEFEVRGEPDSLAVWLRDVRRRIDADRYDHNDAIIGAELVNAVAARLVDAKAAGRLARIAANLRGGEDLGSLVHSVEALEAAPERHGELEPLAEHASSGRYALTVQREGAACSSWYECFPRSTSDVAGKHGTLRDLIGRLAYVQALGFDVCYLPPIHPIGTTARKGPNNSPMAGKKDPGSPWAIGSSFGGHTAIAPELGTMEDFHAVVAAARERGLEIALDLAFQCSPDHPWVREHPDWFLRRRDGSIACAENPPKRYEDVYPINFDTPDRAALYRACLEVVTFWMAAGVLIFRVDNPHTKPFDFWQWLIDAARRVDPDVIFLSEAFTRPKVMHRLAKLGFDQSYTYFTWRDTKSELISYFEELAHGPATIYFRPNVWPNTPDILAKSLQHGGRSSFIARFVLASCLSANYGIYGPTFELLVDEPVAPGSEEYLHAEKYEIGRFDLDDKRSIRDVIAKVNVARKAHPALRRDRSLRFHLVDNDALICWSKRDAASGDAVLCVVNLDPDWAQSGFVELDLAALGLGEATTFTLHDVIDDATYRWTGRRNFVLLDPEHSPAHVFEISIPRRRRSAR